MLRRAVNIATISEEDIMGEEIGEDGRVEVIPSHRLSGERDGLDETDACNIPWRDGGSGGKGRPDSERRSSLVERDDDGDDGVSTSILKAISSLDGPSSKSMPRSRSTESLSYNSYSKAQPGPSPSSTMRRTASWRGSRAPGSTMNLSGKFVTELTLYDPFSGPTKTSTIILGMFIATDQTMGDHFVYKMSPVSPLSALKIQQQDRLLKVNDINVAGWSHNCLVEFVRSLTLSYAYDLGEISQDTAFEMPFSMEFRRTGKAIRSAEESPSSKRVAATIRIRKLRATVMSVHESVVRVKYNTTSTARFRLKDTEEDLYLKANSSPKSIVDVHVGSHTSKEDEVYFRLHHFHVSPALPGSGEVVVIETPRGNGYLHAVSPHSVAVMAMTTPPTAFLQTDNRFFYISYVQGGSAVRIKHISTGHYLSANKDGISLVGLSDDLALPSDTQFEKLSS
ncbi:uncharacterized protein [Macrobrachium rosenbergii]|uniref:uncharacterized protein isoform X1 n=1 Tax=Macrobrachium rosenbergii TaxID=79674 RepID=UPI0034D6A18E